MTALELIHRHEHLVLAGAFGTGKYLLIGLSIAATGNGYRVRYTIATALVNELVEAADEHHLSKSQSSLALPFAEGYYRHSSGGGGLRRPLEFASCT